MSSHYSKLKTGFYCYKPNIGITYLDSHLFYNELPTDCVFVLPHAFHQIVNELDFDSMESVICCFNADNPLLLDLCNCHGIQGLYECI